MPQLKWKSQLANSLIHQRSVQQTHFACSAFSLSLSSFSIIFFCSVQCWFRVFFYFIFCCCLFCAVYTSFRFLFDFQLGKCVRIVQIEKRLTENQLRSDMGIGYLNSLSLVPSSGERENIGHGTMTWDIYLHNFHMSLQTNFIHSLGFFILVHAVSIYSSRQSTYAISADSNIILYTITSYIEHTHTQPCYTVKEGELTQGKQLKWRCQTKMNTKRTSMGSQEIAMNGNWEGDGSYAFW